MSQVIIITAGHFPPYLPASLPPSSSPSTPTVLDMTLLPIFLFLLLHHIIIIIRTRTQWTATISDSGKWHKLHTRIGNFAQLLLAPIFNLWLVKIDWNWDARKVCAPKSLQFTPIWMLIIMTMSWERVLHAADATAAAAITRRMLLLAY